MKELILKGLGVSKGVVQGTVFKYKFGDPTEKMPEEMILVTEITDPTMVFMMIKAKAIVTDIGSIASHPAIVSRELGIPCVTATKTATTELKTGDRVEVNGSSGEIYKILDNGKN